MAILLKQLLPNTVCLNEDCRYKLAFSLVLSQLEFQVSGNRLIIHAYRWHACYQNWLMFLEAVLERQKKPCLSVHFTRNNVQ